MLKSNLVAKLNEKFNNLSFTESEKIIDLFLNKITNSLCENRNIELRNFGTFKNKINKAKFVRNPKTNEKIYKEETKKIHFKIGKTLSKRINEALSELNESKK